MAMAWAQPASMKPKSKAATTALQFWRLQPIWTSVEKTPVVPPAWTANALAQTRIPVSITTPSPDAEGMYAEIDCDSGEICVLNGEQASCGTPDRKTRARQTPVQMTRAFLSPKIAVRQKNTETDPLDTGDDAPPKEAGCTYHRPAPTGPSVFTLGCWALFSSGVTTPNRNPRLSHQAHNRHITSSRGLAVFGEATVSALFQDFSAGCCT